MQRILTMSMMAILAVPGMAWAQAAAEETRGRIALEERDFEQAEVRLERALRGFRAEPRGLSDAARALRGMGRLQLARGDAEAARRWIDEVLRMPLGPDGRGDALRWAAELAIASEQLPPYWLTDGAAVGTADESVMATLGRVTLAAGTVNVPLFRSTLMKPTFPPTNGRTAPFMRNCR